MKVIGQPIDFKSYIKGIKRRNWKELRKTIYYGKIKNVMAEIHFSNKFSDERGGAIIIRIKWFKKHPVNGKWRPVSNPHVSISKVRYQKLRGDIEYVFKKEKR